MAGTSTTNVSIGRPDLSVSGGILVAPIGTPRPTDFESEFDEAYKSVGYLADDGVSESNDRSSDKITAWGGDTAASPQTEFGISLSFTMIESGNVEAARLAHGPANVEVDELTGVLTIKRNSKELPYVQLLIVMLDGENSRIIDVGRCKVTEVGDITYSDSEAIGYEVTVTCFPDEDGQYAIERQKRPSAGAAGE